jgi:hypothetical protein
VLLVVTSVRPDGRVIVVELPGNVVAGYAILASDHSTDSGNITSVIVKDMDGQVLYSASRGEFGFAAADQGFGGRFDMYVLKDSAFSDRAAPLGSAYELEIGQEVFSAERKSPPQGMYQATLTGKGQMFDYQTGHSESSLTVEPNFTTKGDSGSGLYDADGTLYGVLNSGSTDIAVYGPIWRPQAILNRSRVLWQHYFGHGR